MSKIDQKFRRFSNLEGHLQKKSSNILAGFRTKYWKIVDNGTKIGYSHFKTDPIKAQNLFSIKDCLASQLQGQVLFQLITRDRTILLKAPNEQERTDWIKAVTYLKKIQSNPNKIKKNLSPTQTTGASRSQKKKNKKVQKPKVQQQVIIQKPKVYQPEDLSFDKQKQQELIKELLKYLPDKCLKYYTLLAHLKVKSQGLFLDSYNSNTYLMISPKSIYPDVYIGQQNLTNKSLPPWLEVNIFYKLLNNNQKRKQIFHVYKIIDIQQGSSVCSLKINTGEIIYQFFTQTVEQRQCLANCLMMGATNAHQVLVKGKISKRNFDKLIQLQETNLPEFQKQTKKIVNSFIKDPQSNQFQPKKLFQFLDGCMIYLRQFIEVLENKKKNKDHVILDVLKQFHQQIKLNTKLTWDSSFFNIKPADILSMLKKLSQYYQIIKVYIKSSQFLDGMKQLSKIYVRQSWKNFQSIIINVVQQQKRINFQQNQYSEYIQTHGITDLFKFIYNVYQLAAPHWKNRIHLHNVNRLMQRALQVFVNELRSTIDEEVIPLKQMVGLANNYFTFNQFVREFYTQKFQEQLKQKTQQSYEKIIVSYRQVSSIILDKMAFNIGSQVEQYCQSCTIQTIKTERIEQILINQTSFLEKILHMAFLKKLYDKISRQVHLKICALLIDQVKSKKKIKLKQIAKYVKDLRGNLNKVFDKVFKNHAEIDKRMGQLQSIISVELYSDIEQIMQVSIQPTKTTYLKILQLRQDYFSGSALFRIINQSQSIKIKKQQSKAKQTGAADITRQRNATISHQYFEQELMSNADKQQGKDNRISNIKQESRLISEGYLTKGKRNKKVFQKQYFRLKNGVLYIFQTLDSQKCNNAIQIKNVTNVTVANPEKPSFLLTYKTLRKQKEVKLKAETIQIRQKWVYSIQLQRKRINNEEQVRKKNNLIYRESFNHAGKKKAQMILDYEELQKGKDYFSYTS